MNRKYAIEPWNSDDTENTPDQKTLANRAFNLIRKDIISGALPPNKKLKPGNLQKAYGIGLGPIREALTRLAVEGLTTSKGQSGFSVAPVSVKDLNDITRLRVILSVKALELSIKLGGDEWEEHILTRYHYLERIERKPNTAEANFWDHWEKRNRDFHLALEAGCNSSWLIRFCGILYDQYERYRRRYNPSKRIITAIGGEHEKLKELCLQRDLRALDVLTLHIENSGKLLSQRMIADSQNSSLSKKVGQEKGHKKSSKSRPQSAR